MELVETRVDDYRMAAFDGRVLEFFGLTEGRYHTALLSVQVAAVDKHGKRTVTFRQSQQQMSMTLEQDAFERLKVILDALANAGVEVTGSSFPRT